MSQMKNEIEHTKLYKLDIKWNYKIHSRILPLAFKIQVKCSHARRTIWFGTILSQHHIRISRFLWPQFSGVMDPSKLDVGQRSSILEIYVQNRNSGLHPKTGKLISFRDRSVEYIVLAVHVSHKKLCTQV